MHQISYCYTAKQSDKIITFCKAELEDIPQIAELYKSVEINRNNYKTKLDPACADSFKQSGGMLIIYDEPQILKMITDTDSIFMVAKWEKELLGFLWVSKQDPILNEYQPDLPDLKDAYQNKKLVFYREMVVDKATTVSHVASMLFYTASKCMQENGFTYSISEIYEVEGYNDGVRHSGTIFNERSFKAATFAGAYPLGRLPVRTVKTKAFTADIISTVVAFKFASLLPKLKEKLMANNINICED